MKRLNVLNPTIPCADVHSAATVDLGGRAVVLVGLDWTRDKDPRIPLGQASIAASLRAAGARVHNLSYSINSGEFSLPAVVDEVLALAAD
ncbi:MAG: hypothetical protein KC420_02405, partial [Myxococcales bacterium]|nr:hypothetical protein [Myxococcales bacterium]